MYGETMAFIKTRGFFLLLLCGCAFGIIDDCSRNTYNVSDSFMHLTKEIASAEFAISGKFKGLHCCAKGYRSIEWFKDGKPYPWSTSTSGLILYPESVNQTIYTQTVTPEDAGNYTCIIRNDTMLYKHTVQLQVYDNSPDLPKITYLSPNKEVSVGYKVRLFCEAFVGIVDLPDAYNEAIWTKDNFNGSLEDMSRISQEKVLREDGQTLGVYLNIEDLEAEDFGKYICTISTPGRSDAFDVTIREKVNVEYLNPNLFPWKKMIIWSSIFFLIMTTLIILNMRYGLKLRVKFKDRYGTLEENDGKLNDVLVAYSHQDAEFALGTLLPTLESQYNYKCATRELPSSINLWCSNFMDISKKSRRLLAVLSPASTNNQWDTTTLYQAIKQLNSLNTPLTCISLQEIPQNSQELKNTSGETLATLLRTIPVIRWNVEEAEKCWLLLRLRLPSKRTLTENNIQLNDVSVLQTDQRLDSKRLNVHTDDSLDDFV